MLFDLALCRYPKRLDFRQAMKKQKLKVIREDDRYYADAYDSSELLEGSTELRVYFNERTNKLSSVEYMFPSSMDTSSVVGIKNQIQIKYGAPTQSYGNPKVGEVGYTWEAGDGAKIYVNRGWPNTTTFLIYASDNIGYDPGITVNRMFDKHSKPKKQFKSNAY
jgi:hypothetical protein